MVKAGKLRKRYVILLAVLILQGSFCAGMAQTYKQLADSLIERLPLLANDTNKTFVYRDISYYLLFSNPDSALIFSRRGYDLAGKLLFVPGQIWNLNQQGYAYEIKQQYDTAMHCYNEAILLAGQSGDRHAEASLLNVVGTVYFQQGNLSDAIENYDLSAQIFEETDDLAGLSQVLNNLGIVYRVRRNYGRAIDVYTQSLALKRELNDLTGEANTLRNLGLLYAYLNEAEKSLDYLDQAIEIHTVLDNQAEVAACEVGIGSALYTLGVYDEAEAVFAKAIPRLPESHKLELYTARLLSGSIAVKKGNVADGLRAMIAVYETIKQSGRLELLRTAEKELAGAASIVGNSNMAATHWENYALLSDSLASEQQQWAIEEMMAKFESREKENMIQLQSLALAEESAKNKLYLVVGLLFVVLFASATGYAINRVRINKKLQLAHKQTQLALRDKELLLKEMHHRVKNNLQMLSSLLSLQIREISDKKALGVVKSNRSRLHSIALIHQLLYAREDFRQIDMQRFVNNLALHCRQIYDLESKKIGLQTHIDQVLLDIDIATPVGLIINELVVNAIKHAFPHGQEGLITIRLHKQNNKLLLTVCDNGVGMKSETEKKDSFGLKLIQTLVKKMQADLQFVVEKGTSVRFIFETETLNQELASVD